MAISKIGGINLSSISKIGGINKANISKFMGIAVPQDTNLQVSAYWDYPDSWGYPPFYIYYGTDGNLWASYGNSSNATIAKIRTSDMITIGTTVQNSGGSTWGWTNKSDNGTFLFVGSVGVYAVKVTMSNMTSSRFGYFNTNNGCMILSGYLWIGASSLYKYQIDPTNLITSYGIDIYGGFFGTDGTYLYEFRASGRKDIYKINPSNGNVVGTLNIGYDPMNGVQNSTSLYYDGYFYHIAYNNTLYKINPSNMTIVTSLYIPYSHGMTRVGNYLYVALANGTNSGIQKYDISNGIIFLSQRNYSNNLYTMVNDGLYIYAVCDKDSNGNKRIIKTPVF